MTQEEYKKALAEIDAEAERQKEILAKNYAIENNPYKEGDIIQDHIGQGRIKLILGIYWGLSEYPSLKYLCDNLTKKREISKKEPTRIIYQQNIIKQL